MITANDIDVVQEALFGRIEGLMEDGFSSSIENSYHAKTVWQYAQTIDILERFKKNKPE